MADFGPGPPPAPPLPPPLSNSPSPLVLTNYGANSSAYLQSARGTQGAPLPVNATWGMGQFVGQGWDGAAFGYSTALYMRATELFSPTTHGGEMLFFTTPNGATATRTNAGVTQGGALWCGVAVLPAAATDGFFGVPTMAGPPTGVPVINYATAPTVFDTVDKLLWVWGGGAWNGLATQGQPASFSAVTTSGLAGVTVDGAAGTVRALFLATAGSLRFRLNLGAIAESGSNAGSDFVIIRYSDAGASLGTALGITRATGLTSLYGGLALSGSTAHGVLVGQNTAAATSVAPGTAGQVLTSQGAAADPVFASGAAGQISGNPNPAAPTGSTSSMMGMGAATNPCVFTPTRSGRVLLIFTGAIFNLFNSPANSGVIMSLWYGTGAAPANGAAVTGTQVGQSLRAVMGLANGATGNDVRPFTICQLVSGLTVGTTYWADLSQTLSITTALANAQNVQFNFMEQ